MEFELNPSLSVDTVWYHGQAIGFQHTTGGIVHIPLSATLPSDWPDSIEIVYHGQPSATGFGSIESSQHNGTPVMWTLSEPYGARDWWPCKQTLNDKIDSIDVPVSCPEPYLVASNGLLAGQYDAQNG